ncbi:alcohol dehydrogenase catalytic domain-containing protein [Streptomyces sp. NPDC050263]|uniref:alcohol dehydrogenase catalytic domain-containing protein n=1 Tax=Streptomyces sp. NPDC050263 TaxID=3155037 RepID=UPI003412F3A9
MEGSAGRTAQAAHDDRAVVTDPTGALSEGDVLGPVDGVLDGPGRVLVRVTAAGIGFADVQIRAGLMRQTALPDLPMPFSPGFEVAGTVVAVGPGVDPTTVGRRVVGATAGGGYAETAIVSAAAALPCPARTRGPWAVARTTQTRDVCSGADHRPRAVGAPPGG